MASLRNAFLLPSVLLALLPAASHPQEPADQPMMRWRFFYEQRAFPFDRVPAGALQQAYRQMQARWPDVIAGDPVADFTTSSSAWSAIGPAPINTGSAGRISTIAVHPADPSTIYIGAAQGGVWKSTDYGLSWRPLTDDQCSLAMGSLAIDPVNPAIVYAGTGELHFSADSYYGCGVLRSTDGGDSWTRLGSNIFDTSTGGARISRVLIDPRTAGSTSSTTVLAASSIGVYISLDSGLTWTRTLDGVATDLALEAGVPGAIYAAIGTIGGSAANGVYRSTDGGATWNRLAGFPTDNVGRIALAASPSTSGILYAAVQDQFGDGGNDGRLLGIWKTVDSGSTWTRLQAAVADCGAQCWYNLTIAADPLDPDIVYFGGVLLYRSDDGGASFRNILRNIHVDQHALTFDPSDPGTLYVGNDGGIFRSRDGGTTWIGLNDGLAITQFYAGISLHPSDTTVVLGGTQDNGTLEFSGSLVWSAVLGADGGFTAIDHRFSNIAWAETQWSAGSGFSGPRLRNAPGPFTDRRVTGIDLDDRALFIPPLVMDPANSARLYFGTFRVYRTTNRGVLWSPISGDLSRTGSGRVSAIAPAHADSMTVYVGTSDGNLQVTRDGGASWEIRRGGLPQRHVTDIAVDAFDADIAIATVSGFNTGHVFRTVDGGRNWIDISGDLPDVPVNAVLTDPSLGVTIYAGTDLGVFRSHDFGASWEPFNAGLPNVAVFDIAYNRNTGIAAAGTHGRGVFVFRPVTVATLAIDRDTVRFASLGDTLRLGASAFDIDGAPIPALTPTWRALDDSVVTVDAAGLVRSIGNGQSHVVASLGGAADTVRIVVDQVAVAFADLPPSIELVVGETRELDARAVDAAGRTVIGASITWSTSDPQIAAIDATGTLTAASAGATSVIASFEQVSDSSRLSVEPPATTAVSAASVPTAMPPISASGTRLPLLTLRISVAGVEPVRMTAFGFDVTGDDPDASFQLLHDADASGTVDDGEPVLAASAVSLRAGQPQRVTLAPGDFIVPADGDARLIVAIRLSGRSPNDAAFQTTYLPEQTASVGTRSGARNRLVLPPAPVASAEVRSTLLAVGQVLSFSENPVRSTHVTFNFQEEPAVAAVYTVSGRLVVDLTRRIEAGRVDWDLRNGNGNLVAPGVYLIVFRIGATVLRERLVVLRPGAESDATANNAVHRPPHSPS